MHQMNKLHDEHDRLLVLVRELATVIAKTEPPPPVELFELRSKLASTLIGHLKTEDWDALSGSCCGTPTQRLRLGHGGSATRWAAWPARSGSMRSAGRR